MSVKIQLIGLLCVSVVLTTASISNAGTNDSEMSRDRIRQIQTSLKSAGFDPGPIDGVVGHRTKQAVRFFQYDTGILATGNINDETQSTLGLDVARPGQLARVEESETAARTAENPNLSESSNVSSVGDVKRFQRILQDLEYNPGEINGLIGSDTQQALREFQLLNALPVSGIVDEQTKTALEAQHSPRDR